jgi:hypothetical protein
MVWREFISATSDAPSQNTFGRLPDRRNFTLVLQKCKELAEAKLGLEPNRRTHYSHIDRSEPELRRRATVSADAAFAQLHPNVVSTSS